jgi:hypothetical protein
MRAERDKIKDVTIVTAVRCVTQDPYQMLSYVISFLVFQTRKSMR